MQHLARSFPGQPRPALDLFATLPAQAAQGVLHSGTWDLADYVRGAVATRADASPSNLPLPLGAIVLLSALSSSAGRRRKDRW